jgi:hypothetical protein
MRMNSGEIPMLITFGLAVVGWLAGVAFGSARAEKAFRCERGEHDMRCTRCGVTVGAAEALRTPLPTTSKG